MRNLNKKLTIPIQRWKAVLTRFTIMFRNRIALNGYQTRRHKPSGVRRNALKALFAGWSEARGANPPYGIIHIDFSP
jgi:hypothetical protein